MNPPEASSGSIPPRGMIAFGVFLFCGAFVASLAGATLAWPGTILDRIWDLNPRAYRELAPYGRTPGILFLGLGVALAIAGVGWLRRRLWGWRLAVAVIVAQISGDLLNLSMGRAKEGVAGVVIAGALLFYLTRAKVQRFFKTTSLN